MVIRGRHIIALNSSTPTNPNPNPDVKLIKVKVEFETVVNPAVSFADLKYNKNSGLLMVKDDGGIEDYTVAYAYLHGGIQAKDGNVYQGIRYSDGCGNLVEPHYTFAINTDKSRLDSNPFEGLTTWGQYKTMAASGYSIANHTWHHGGYDRYTELKQNEKNIYDNTGLRTRTFVIPTADEGYAESAPYLGYKMVGSAFGASSTDDNNNSGNENIVWTSKVDSKAIDMKRLDKFLFSRYYLETWSETDRADILNLANIVLTQSTNGKKYVGHFFSHGLLDGSNTMQGFKNYISYVMNHPSNNDSIWLPSMQEFSEYFETKFLVNKTQSLSGKTLTVELDLSNLPEEGLNRDMSLLVSGGTIKNVNVEGSDSYTFNPGTGLINIFKKNKAVKDPNTDTAPPQIISAVKSGSKVNLTYDRPVTQSVFASAYGNAYSVSGNTVVNVTGSGTSWSINCQNTVSAGSKFDYRMQRGNASDADGMKVCTYIEYPIS